MGRNTILSSDLTLGPAAVSSGNLHHHHHHYHHQLVPDLHALELYHKALEDERQKIQAFERELPFCMQLLDDAIEASREQLADRLTCKLSSSSSGVTSASHQQPRFNLCASFDATNYTSNSHHNARTSLPDHFLALKRIKGEPPHATPRAALHQLAEEEEPSINIPSFTPWLGLKHKTHLHCPKDKNQLIKSSYDTVERTTNACCNVESQQPIKESHFSLQEDVATKILLPKDQSTQTMGMMHLSNHHAVLGNETTRPSNGKLNTQTSSPSSLTPGAQRKPRRCWSPELHQLFLNALHQLGGCQVATPKQIRELMNVQGLTNDEVKSHLQKFRLHMRRPSLASQGDANQQGAHHLLVFGHIWMPQSSSSTSSPYGSYNVSSHAPNNSTTTLELCTFNDAEVSPRPLHSRCQQPKISCQQEMEQDEGDDGALLKARRPTQLHVQGKELEVESENLEEDQVDEEEDQDDNDDGIGDNDTRSSKEIDLRIGYTHTIEERP